MKTLAPITYDELLAELGVSAPPADSGWHTSAELADHWKMNQSKASAILRTLYRAGRLESRQVRRQSMDGKNVPVPGYRIKPAKKGK